MTTAHRPTFDPAKGKEAQRGPAYHQRLLPAHTQLKVRKPGQGGDADRQIRDLRAELLQAEAAHYAKLKGAPIPALDGPQNDSAKRRIEDGKIDEGADEDPDIKRRRILEESRDIDADSEDEEESSEDDSEDEEDETAELQRELEKIKRERAERREQEEQEKAAQEEARRESDIARGNPLLNTRTAFDIKRRWDDDVVFKNQARGTETKVKKEFVNDLLRSDFHKKFMSKYVK
ncbi:Pre-mRNA-splicing factor cwc15 [Erysiphe necator]|uniref:Putative pre-mrna-splicing factor cwc15 n=1 Tax=Uncinula necator TaxID=52586 RepID=A0A0B1PAF2_UNCNE|nr:Pre-mRNA-splicing factor cwc15 [Erysiphe necator]KHJ35677.1 putative pre-mrna-splicing factor cwc15 [Erysiphe necator]